MAADTPNRLDPRTQEELDRLRARDRALRIFADEQNPPTPLPEMLTLRERITRGHPDIEWRIEGWQPAGTRVMLAAQYKAGKTSLVGNLARSLADGTPFLGSAPVAQIPHDSHLTIVDFEMGERQLDAWLSDQMIIFDSRIVVVALRGKVSSFNILNDLTRQQWARLLKGTEYLIVDPLRPILDALGLDEHREAGRFLTAFDALCDEADIPDALVVHHMGHSGERSRGDSRLRDWPDVEWRLVRQDDDPASTRYVSAYGRDVDQEESELAFDVNTRHLTLLGGSRGNAAARAALEDVLSVLRISDEALTQNRIVEAVREETDHPRSVIIQAVKLGVENAVILRERGPRNSFLHSHCAKTPHRSVTAPDQSPTTAPKPIRVGAVVKGVETETTAPLNGVCEVCDFPGDLVAFGDTLAHPQCAPANWKPEPTPEEIAP